jgi:hypothetical protein
MELFSTLGSRFARLAVRRLPLAAWAGVGDERSNAPAKDPAATGAAQSRRLIPLSLKERHDGHDVRRRGQKVNEMHIVWYIIADDALRSQGKICSSDLGPTVGYTSQTSLLFGGKR